MEYIKEGEKEMLGRERNNEVGKEEERRQKEAGRGEKSRAAGKMGWVVRLSSQLEFSGPTLWVAHGSAWITARLGLPVSISSL